MHLHQPRTYIVFTTTPPLQAVALLYIVVVGVICDSDVLFGLLKLPPLISTRRVEPSYEF